MSTTWTDNGLSASAVCTTGTESAPSAATAGLSLNNNGYGGRRLGAVSVTLAADSGQTLSGAGTLLAYLYHSALQAWTRAPDLDLGVTQSSVRGQTWFVGQVLVGLAGSRIAYAPSAVTVSSGGLTVYVDGDL